jgi:hypothetical protein
MDNILEKYMQIGKDGFKLYNLTGVAVALMDIIEKEAQDNWKLKYEYGRTIEPMFDLLIDAIDEIGKRLQDTADELCGELRTKA